MTIECYIADCPHHSTNDGEKEEGPFCHREHCAWTSKQIEAKAYLNIPLKLVKPTEVIQLTFMSELFGTQGDKSIIMKGILVAPNLQEAFIQALDVWPFKDPPFAMNLGPYTGEDDKKEEEASDADVHRA